MADAGRDGAAVEDDPAALAALVLEEEQRRDAERAERGPDVPDTMLPGMGAKSMGLREAIRIGGLRTLVVIFFISMIDEFDRIAAAVLAPDIQSTLNISDTTLIGIVGFGGVVLVLGSVPLAWLADRVKRVRIMQVSNAFAVLALLFNAAAVNPFLLFWARAAVGASHAYRLPVHNSLLADTYPIQARARVFSLDNLGRPLGLLIGPLFVGAVAAIIGGSESWRWVFVVCAIFPAIAVIGALTLREPKRAANEKQIILGDAGAELMPDLPVPFAAAFERLKKIKTFYFLCVGIGTLGFALVAAPVQLSLLYENVYGYDAYRRGWVTSLGWIVSLFTIPLAGAVFDRIFRVNPPKVLRLAGTSMFLYGLVMLIALRFQNPWWLIGGISIANGFTSASFVAVGPTVAAVAPFRMRAQAFSIVPVFIFLMGGFFGGLIAGSLSDSFGERTALTIVVPPAAFIGGLLVMYGSRYLRRDMALAVDELLEEQKELKRMAEQPEDIPLLQVRGLDVSYGPVQVLFGVDVDVREGEVLALLGTNGAGKSTLLRAVCGLTLPDRGVIRLDGRTITYADAEARFREGILQVRGGSGVFRNLTVDQNLRTALLTTGVDKAETERRIRRVYDLFPVLEERSKVEARWLSGGQQQMLALGMCLVHEPRLLLIDELSLGLAPVVVQELLQVLEGLRRSGVTMIVVEQSINVALAFADRAVFMEKGRIRFEGPAQELLERDDLVRAVFLGREGG